MKNSTENFLIILMFSAIIITIMFAWFVKEPTGYYKQTQMIQSNGTYYIWVENTK